MQPHCPKCNRSRTPEHFYPYASECKSCRSQRSKQWAQTHPIRVKELRQAWHHKHPTYRRDRYHRVGRDREYEKQYYAANREKIILRSTTRLKANPLLVSLYNRTARTKMSPEEKRARYLLNKAVQQGIIDRPTHCSRCPRSGRIHAHHARGYTDPYDVDWLCARCHKAAHGYGPEVRPVVGTLLTGELSSCLP